MVWVIIFDMEGHNNQNSEYLTSKSWPKEFYFAKDTIYVCYEYFF